MVIYVMTQAEGELADIIWEAEPVPSGSLVKLAAENYNGSLPGFVAAFLKHRKLSRQEIEELERMIEDYKEEQ